MIETGNLSFCNLASAIPLAYPYLKDSLELLVMLLLLLALPMIETTTGEDCPWLLHILIPMLDSVINSCVLN